MSSCIFFSSSGENSSLALIWNCFKEIVNFSCEAILVLKDLILCAFNIKDAILANNVMTRSLECFSLLSNTLIVEVKPRNTNAEKGCRGGGGGLAVN